MTDFPDPEVVGGGPRPVDELVGQTIHIADVGDLGGTPLVILADGRAFLCEGDWSQKCAAVAQAELATNGQDSIEVKVVEEKGQVGFRE